MISVLNSGSRAQGSSPGGGTALCSWVEILCQYSQLSLNQHLVKTDTLCWSWPFFSHFAVIKLPIRQTPLEDGQRTL